MGAENPTDQELIQKLTERVTQLESDNDSQAKKIEDLEAKVESLESEETGEPEPPAEESEELKQLKRELVQETDKLANDRAIVTADEDAIRTLEQRIAATT